MSTDLFVYLNGEVVRHKDAKVSVDDRGFLFADGIYEVMKLQDKFIFTEKEHFARLRRGLKELRIDADAEVDKLPSELINLVAVNKLEGECYCYIQITRGSAAGRSHAWLGGPVVPTVYAIVKPFSWPAPGKFEAGNGAISVPDMRWARCDIKTVSLLPNVLANQRAHEAGCYEALLLRAVDGEDFIVEASHSNVFAVMRAVDGTLEIVTPEEANILPGVTRLVTLQRCAKDEEFAAQAYAAGLGRSADGSPAFRIGNIPLAGLWDGRIQELFVTASTSFVQPIVTVDGKPVAGGKTGAITTAMRDAWLRWWASDKAASEAAAHGSALS